MQVKHATSDGKVIPLRCRTHTIVSGRVRSTKRYTAELIEWLAVWDCTTGICCYVPAVELGPGMSLMHLRLRPARNNQLAGIRMAANYRTLPPLV